MKVLIVILLMAVPVQGKMINGLLGSLSFRNANIDGEPYDYEIVGGLSGDLLTLKVKYERENGELYRGLKLKTEEVSGYSMVIHIDEAHNINRQYIYKTLLNINDRITVRSTNEFNQWSEYRVMFGMVIDLSENNLMKFQYDTNLYDRHIGRLYLTLSPIRYGNIAFTPMYRLESFDNNKSWQAKIEVSIKL